MEYGEYMSYKLTCASFTKEGDNIEQVLESEDTI